MTINLRSSDLVKALEIILLVAILGVLLWTQFWRDSSTSETRKITVSGEGIVEAAPDEFAFSPYFEAKGTDKEALKQTLTAQANEAVNALKNLGVAEDDISLDLSSYDQWYWQENEEGVLQALLQITVADKELAQKVQDYLLSTTATGQLTSTGSFSENKQKELEKQAVDKAVADAKQRAEQQATQLGVKVGKVITVEQSDTSGVFPMAFDSVGTLEAGAGIARSSSVPVLQGKDEYRQTVTVTYELQ